jgi:hypothetical protein
MRVHEVGRLAVALRCRRTIAAGGGDHRQTLEAIAHVGILLEEVLGGAFGLLEATRVNQVDDAVRRLIEAVNPRRRSGPLARAFGLAHEGGGALGRSGGLVALQTAPLVFLAAAAVTGIVAPDLGHHLLGGPRCTPLYRREAVRRVARHQSGVGRHCAGRRLPALRRMPRPRGLSAPAARRARDAEPGLREAREAFCCDEDDSRKRPTPASVSFLGRRVYLGAAAALACVLRLGPTPWRVSRLHALPGGSARTLARWHR